MIKSLSATALLLFSQVWIGNEAAAANLDYNRDIRPILSDKCYTCHGPDHNKRKAGLRLDRKEEPFKKLDSGKTAIIPGKPEESELARRITTTFAEDKMPPAEAKQLSRAEIDTLRRWIKEGATWSGHWAYTPPRRPALPSVHNRAWVRNAIDAFILARLEKENLHPSRPADKAQLLRRLTLDLTGLPPTIEELNNFLSDKSLDAYEKVVDRLLSSPAFGERMAQAWLDLARFADTNGYHIDNHRDMWLWRDWVIKAFNRNMPFDQFTIEQLAGDMLPSATLDQKIASGFNRNNMVNFEGGADPEEYATKYVEDRVVTTSTTWLGTTMGCCECHDHKYDPFTQKDFYQLYAIFNNIPEKGLDGRNENPVPSIKVPSAHQAQRKTELEKAIDTFETELKKKLSEPNPELDGAQAKWEDELKLNVSSNWTTIAPQMFAASSGAVYTNLTDHSVRVATASAKDAYHLTFETSLTNITGIRIETLPEKIAGGATNDFVLTGFTVEAQNPEPRNDVPLDADAFGDWYALGPFKFGSVLQAFSRAMIDEKQAQVDLNKTYEDGTLHWIRKSDWKDGEVRELEGGDFNGYYLYRTITVKNARQMLISLGSRDAIQVWLNGKKILAHQVIRTAAPDQEKLILWLAPGENHLLLKVTNGSGGLAYYFKAQESVPDSFPVQFAAAVSDHHEQGFDVRGLLEPASAKGWAVGDAAGKEHHAVFISKQAFGFPAGTVLKLKLSFDSATKRGALRHFRISLSSSDRVTEAGELPANVQSFVFRGREKRPAEQTAEVTKFFREANSDEVSQLNKRIASTRIELSAVEASIPSTMVMEEMQKPRDTFILLRGDFQHKGTKVSPALPQALFDSANGSMPTNRLQLARWLVSTNQPLTARVTVNRFWQMLFGTGLVKTANDFGSQGEWPSHPELLDWLATEFMNGSEGSVPSGKWDIKHIIKLMVMSATYRQSSDTTPQLLERDRYNRLLARGARFRMDAEFIRDNALAISGLLKRKVGGPSVRPYQPAGLWEAISFGVGFTSQNYVQSKGEELYRRGLYVYWKRSMPYPSMVTFDAPSHEVCLAQRARTTTPLQALVLMNDPAYLEAARVFGQRIIQEGGSGVDAKLRFAFRTALSRDASRAELAVLSKIYREQLSQFRAQLDDAAKFVKVGESPLPENMDVSELAAWTAIGNILLNLDETITKG